MIQVEHQTSSPPDGGDVPYQLELYIAGDALSSRRAIENISAIVKRLDNQPTVMVVDVLHDPKVAFRRHIFATPSLIAVYGNREALVVGDLSDQEVVLKALEICFQKS